MTSKDSELEAVRFVLDKDWPDGTTSNDVAKAVIKAIDDLRSTTWRPVGPPVKVGEPFKSIISAKTHYVLWIGDDGSGVEYAWIVTGDSEYGSFSPSSSPFWKWTTETRVMQKTIDKVTTNPSYAVGELVQIRQGGLYEILAVHQNGVLFRDMETQAVWPESNHSLDKYYKKIKREEDW